MENTGISSRPLQQPRKVGNMTRKFTDVLVARPDYFAISEAKNPFARGNVFVDLPLACEQWNNLCESFKRAGLEVSVLDPDPNLEDMCFTAPQAFVGIDRDERSFAIPSRMLHRSRRDEVPAVARWYSHQGYRIVDLELEGEEFLEGASDLLWNADWQSVWAGFGRRSTRAAVDQFAALMESMEFPVHKLEIVDPHFHHLNLCLNPLTPQSLLIYPGAFAPETLARIRGWANTIEVTREEALQFVCNGVAVNGYYIAPHLSHRVEQILGKEGIEPMIVDLSEFQKAGASVASLKMLLP